MPDDHRDGQPHPARLRARRRRRHARGVRRGDPPRDAPLGLRQAARRPAADAERARRPRGRVRGGDDRRDAARPRLRRGARRRRARRRCSRASPPPVAQVLDLQAGAGARRRGARVPRRQRLRRGVGHAAPLSARARSNSIWEGSGNVHVPRRAARDGARTPSPSRRSPTRSGEGAAADPGSTRSGAGCATSWPPIRRRSRAARAASSSAWRSRCRPRCWSATATRRSPTPSAPRASPATAAAPSARCRPAPTSGGSSSGTQREIWAPPLGAMHP